MTDNDARRRLEELAEACSTPSKGRSSPEILADLENLAHSSTTLDILGGISDGLCAALEGAGDEDKGA